MPMKIPDPVNTAVTQQRIGGSELKRPEAVDGGAVNVNSQLDVARDTLARQDVVADAHTTVVGDASARNASQRQEIGGGVGVRLAAGAPGVLFSDLPKPIQDKVKDHIERHNAHQRGSFSPQNIEFLRASERNGVFDVTFAVRGFAGQIMGERQARFGEVAPVPPPAPTVTGDAITALEKLPGSARAAIEARIETINERESASMSPRFATFVSATPLSDGGFDITLKSTTMFGDERDSTLRLGANGQFS